MQGDGLLDPFLRRGLAVEPRQPAEIREDRMADDAAGWRLEITVTLEIEAQRGVGPLIATDGGDDVRGVIERGLVGHE